MSSLNRRAWVIAVGLALAPAVALGEDGPERSIRLDAVYAGPAYAPLLGVGVVAGGEWRLRPWMVTGVELGWHDQSPLRTNFAARALLIFDYTFAFGGHGAVRIGTGYRHVVVHGETYALRDGQAETVGDAGCALWSTTAELAVGFDARGPLGWPLRLTVAPGIQASYPQLDRFGVDLWLTTRVAWTF